MSRFEDKLRARPARAKDESRTVRRYVVGVTQEERDALADAVEAARLVLSQEGMRNTNRERRLREALARLDGAATRQGGKG